MWPNIPKRLNVFIFKSFAAVFELSSMCISLAAINANEMSTMYNPVVAYLEACLNVRIYAKSSAGKVSSTI